MRYMADVLTLFRLVVGLLNGVFILMGEFEAAFVLFGLGILSDAFDGMLARRFPYTQLESEWLFWRRNPDAWDIMADATLVFVTFMILSYTQLGLFWTVGFIAANFAMSASFIRAIAAMKQRNLKRAKLLDITYRWLFVAQLVALLVWLTVLATPAWPWFMAVYAVAGALLLRMKWDHATFKDDPTYK